MSLIKKKHISFTLLVSMLLPVAFDIMIDVQWWYNLLLKETV